MIKPLILSTSDLDGGAARAAYRLHRGFREIEVPSQMLVRAKDSADNTVIGYKPPIASFGSKLDILPLNLYRKRERTLFSPQWFPDAIAPKVREMAPDIINLHWACNGYLRIETLPKLKRAIVWTLHDMWAFTGGCHYNQTCDRFQVSCGACPQLNSGVEWDLSRWIWQRKASAWRDLNLTLVTPSRWLAQYVRDSALFRDRRVEAIPNGIDPQTYKPVDAKMARDLLGLPQDKNIVLFGAMGATSDRRKGFHLLQPALQYLSQLGWSDRVELAIFGACEPESPPDLGFVPHYLGKFNDDVSLALVYSAADVFVVPSVQDNLSNTVMEAIACGTPCVTFDIGGMGEMIEHQHNGYLAKPYEIEDFARGIEWVIEDFERYGRLSDRARAKVEAEFTCDLQARRYFSLFNEILEV